MPEQRRADVAATGRSSARGLYRPEFEHDACGIGALANLHGARSHRILDDALSVLVNLEHRGGTGLERNTGDGAGILFQVPHRFFRKEAQKCGQILPDEGDYGVAMLFLPQDERGVADARRVFEEGCAASGVPLLFWREVPVDPHDLGPAARACMPTILQAFLGRPDDAEAGDAFERRLYVCRRTVEKRADAESALSGKIFYVCSMSSRTIVYKGMLVATQMRRFFIDLNDAAVTTAVALVHSRYSTNTTPSWERAHPNRYIIHNGEINTLKGNVNWIRAREPNLYSPVLGADLERVMPIINREGSDSAILDNVLEFLVMNGRSMTRAVSLLIPEPWDHNDALPEARRAYDAYQSMLMEPWDGPAAIAFTDGRTLGAALDRNGLRPARYYVTRDDRFLLASEVGTIDIEPENILTAGCLGPGEMLEVDFAQGRVVYNDEIRAAFAKQKPYRDWIADETLDVADLDAPAEAPAPPDAGVPLALRMAKLGYHWDDVDEVVRPMAERGSTPLASMGIDAPLACLSSRDRSFFDYFYQLFAQVTNPPIDALREHMVTSTVLYLGNHGNLLEDSRASCRLVRLPRPLLDADGFARICSIRRVGFRTQVFRAVYRRADGDGALEAALTRLAADVEAAVRDGVNIAVLSDRAGEGEVPVPSLLAVGAVHNHLIRAGLRTFADLVVECGDAVSAHDFAALVGYSASGIYPYMAHDCIRSMAARGDLSASDGRALTADEAVANYNRAAVAGIVSIMSKMGISTAQSYHSAQIFEAVGLSDEVVDRYFTGTVSRVGGLILADLQRDQDARYDRALAWRRGPAPDQLPSLGLTKWRPVGGEDHLIDPQVIYLLQRACREDDAALFEEYSARLHRPGRAVRLRDLLDFDAAGRTPIPLEQVEGARSIVRRFNTGAMSFGSISAEAHECMAVAMNRLHGRSNSGEGGEDPRRETPRPNGDSANSAIKQVASGRFGVTSRYLCSATEIQIKMAQGAKPGEGGHLPGRKVYPWVAEVRRSTPGIGLISPPPHHDIYSIEDLAELIFDLKCANPDARVSVKLVSEAGVGTIATGVAKGAADKILISGHNGGSGAAPRDSIWHAGLPLELGLAEAQQTLVRNGLRSRVVLRGRRQAHGRLRRRRRLPAGRRGVRVRHHAAGRHGLPHAARLPSGHLPGGHRHAELPPAPGFRRQARARRALHALRGRAAAAHHGAPGLRHGRGDGGPSGVPAPGRGARQRQGRPARPLSRARGGGVRVRRPHPGCRREALPARDGGGLGARPDAGRHAVRAADGRRARAPATGALPCRHRQHQPLRGRHARPRRDAGPRRRPARGVHHGRLRRLGGAELRRVPAGGRHAQRLRRRQRLLRQGAVGRRALGAPLRARHVQVRRERHRGQRGLLRRHGRARLRERPGGPALLRAQLRRHRGGRGRGRPRLRVHDRRVRGRAGRGGPELRGGHDRRRGFRVRRERDAREPRERGGRGAARAERRRARPDPRAHRGARPLHGQPARHQAALPVRGERAALREGRARRVRARDADRGGGGARRPHACGGRGARLRGGDRRLTPRAGCARRRLHVRRRRTRDRPHPVPVSRCAPAAPPAPVPPRGAQPPRGRSKGSLTMGKPGAFLTHDRRAHELRPVSERVRDFDPLYVEPGEDERRAQASRCMMCGVAFCQAGVPFGSARPSGCPLHNLIPEWNELVYRGRWDEAAARLSLTSPMPEFTSRVCPALCEAACNLGSVEGEPTTIHDNERAISDHEWASGGPRRFDPPAADAPRAAVVGSGPAGLVCAWELARRGARVRVYERDDRPGGLLMYGIPNMKLEKQVVERRVALMRELGIEFSLGVDATAPEAVGELSGFDAVVVAAGARAARGLAAEGVDAPGVAYAVDYLTEATRALLDGGEPAITAAGLDVVVVGGGDTGNDCVATAVRQGARSVRQLEFMPRPPQTRLPGNPWPEWPNVCTTGYGQQEAIELAGGEMREWAVDTLAVERDGEGRAAALRLVDLDWRTGRPERLMDTERTYPAQLVLIACGFTGPERSAFEALGAEVAGEGRPLPVMAAEGSHRCAAAASAAGPVAAGVPVFAAGDARCGSSLVVSAMADALACAAEVAGELGL